MGLPRLLVAGDLRAGERIALRDAPGRYLGAVLRLAPGDAVILFDGGGREARAVLERKDRDGVLVRVESVGTRGRGGLSVHLFQSLPKADRMALIVQKTTELGVSSITPFLSRRSVPRPDADRMEGRRARWERIAAEASRQCGRADVPRIGPLSSFAAVLAGRHPDTLGLLLWEGEAQRLLKDILRGRSGPPAEIAVVVGPEGGFDPDEAAQAEACGFSPVSLGPRLLRTETAPIAVLAILQYEWGSPAAPPAGCPGEGA